MQGCGRTTSAGFKFKQEHSNELIPEEYLFYHIHFNLIIARSQNCT